MHPYMPVPYPHTILRPCIVRLFPRLAGELDSRLDTSDDLGETLRKYGSTLGVPKVSTVILALVLTLTLILNLILTVILTLILNLIRQDFKDMQVEVVQVRVMTGIGGLVRGLVQRDCHCHHLCYSRCKCCIAVTIFATVSGMVAVAVSVIVIVSVVEISNVLAFSLVLALSL